MKAVLTPLFIILIPVMGWSFYETAILIDVKDPINLAFFGALLLAAAIHFARTRKKHSYFATFEHELTHNIWALLTFNKPAGFHINDDGTGEFAYYGKSNFLQMLGPYVTLTIPYLLLPVYYVLNPAFALYYFIVLGIATGYQTASTIKETGFHQSDIQRQGLFFSVVFIILGNLISYGLVLGFLVNRGTGMKYFLTTGFLNAWELIQPLLTKVMG